MTPEQKVALLKEAGVWDVIGFPSCIDRLFDLVAENTSIEQQREIARLKAIIEEQANGAQNLVLAEREACAKVCEDIGGGMSHPYVAQNCAAAIRARGE